LKLSDVTGPGVEFFKLMIPNRLAAEGDTETVTPGVSD
jgi:hypothetical protein